MVSRIFVFYSIVNFCLHTQSRSLQESVEQVYGVGGLGGVSFVQLLHTFCSTQEALGEEFKETWVRVNPKSPIMFV